MLLQTVHHERFVLIETNTSGFHFSRWRCDLLRDADLRWCLAGRKPVGPSYRFLDHCWRDLRQRQQPTHPQFHRGRVALQCGSTRYGNSGFVGKRLHIRARRSGRPSLRFVHARHQEGIPSRRCPNWTEDRLKKGFARELDRKRGFECQRLHFTWEMDVSYSIYEDRCGPQSIMRVLRKIFQTLARFASSRISSRTSR